MSLVEVKQRIKDINKLLDENFDKQQELRDNAETLSTKLVDLISDYFKELELQRRSSLSEKTSEKP